MINEIIQWTITGLSQAFFTALALAFNEWLFKKRIEKALNKFEETIKEKLNGNKN